MNYVEIARSAEWIGVAKGENSAPNRRAFEEATGIELPFDRSGNLSRKSQGIKFVLLRGMDVPARVNEGIVDFGVAGSDALLEYDGWPTLKYQEVGDIVCRFSVLAQPDTKARIEGLLNARPSNLLALPTSNPKMLNNIASAQELPFVAMDMLIGGGVEAYAELTGVGAVADIVQTGATASANNLEEVYKLRDIYTALMWRRQDEGI